MFNNDNAMNELVNDQVRCPKINLDTYVKMIQHSIDTFGNAFIISIPKVYAEKLRSADYYCQDIQGRKIEIDLEPRGWSASIFGYRKFRVVFKRVQEKAPSS